MFHRTLLVALLSAALCLAGGPLRFRVRLMPSAASHAASGRLLVFMTDEAAQRNDLTSGFFPGRAWIAAQEVESLAPGATIDFDPDVLAAPHPFSKAKPGAYQFMALLDTDHSYAHTRKNAGDLYGPVVRIARIDPANAAPVELTLTKVVQDRAPEGIDDIKIATFQSPLLTAWWGRPITMRAGIVLPPDYAKFPGGHYPAIYVHHGFDGDYRFAFQDGPRMRRQMLHGHGLDAVLVFLDGSFPSGDHEFADSVNNGPWGRALTTEFIPYLERTYRLIPSPGARFLTGHSSGGWASLWLQVTYPDFFGGTWSTAPDPVDFRSFCGVNATPGSKDNVYRHNLVRDKGKDLISWEQWAREEEVQGDYGGQLASFEWVFSPRDPGGRAQPLFNRVTGELNPAVVAAWQQYDIRRKLDREWPELGPKLQGKLNVICGGEDTFHLDEAVKLLCQFLKDKGSDGVCEIVPGRTHMDLYEPYKTYPQGLWNRITREMQAKFESRRASGSDVQ